MCNAAWWTAFSEAAIETIIKRKRIRITALEDDNGDWVMDAERLKNMVVNHFQALYSSSDNGDVSILSNGFPVDGSTRLQQLDSPVSSAEIGRALFDVKPYKAPGPDGFQAIFYQHNWETVGPLFIHSSEMCLRDNIVIAQELVHTMSRLRGDKKFMSGKIDLEKAYDRLSWTFIADTLVKAGLPPNLRRKAIARAWNQVSKGAKWAVGRGDRVRFWEDVWIPGGSSLLTHALVDIPPQLCNKPVADFIGVDGSWRWELFSHLLNNNTLLHVASGRPPQPGAASDRLYWSHESSGMFSVSSAYWLLVEHTLAAPLAIWRLIWRWSGPQRVRHFLGLVAHDRLLTNEFHLRTLIATSASCSVCLGQTESIIHVLRDCTLAREVWLRLVPTRQQHTFFSLPLQPWFMANLQQDTLCSSGSGWSA
ncbi:hypothetical protein CRG98_020048 [Punica granatum]|uniref:Reverse transcriptase zinc-binding domain-containing protein n=1 Tax=Punica granatum TaxID=22663 RepID=A0A2I0JUE7_PUNGR|nr:hypothetical protein CRG98_020048 [Punica granatum]